MNALSFIAELLQKRGFTDPESQDRFLNPDYDMHTYDPMLLPDIEKAIDRVFSAIIHNEKICIYSDYDADGIPGAVIMHDFFKKIGYENVMFYIPHRHSEGYGLHRDALEKISTDGVRLLITVDLGITAHGEVVYARELGMDIIITDHHEPLETIPEAVAVVNPKIPKAGILYPDTMLCGCGTAFKFIQAMLKVLRREIVIDDIDHVIEKLSVPHSGWEKWLLDMVGIATLSDMVPLVNENRVFAKYGLQVVQKTKRPGLLALFQVMRMRPETITEDDIVFSITPRLNAASRMAHPEIAFQLLTTDDSVRAREIALELSRLNDERKLEVARAMRTLHKKLSARESLPKILVVGDPDWSPGVLGLIASKIVEEYDRTVFVWCIEGDTVKGSCRARNGDHVVDLMNSIAEDFIQYGGHEGAGGFSMEKEKIHFLEDRLNSVADAVVHDEKPEVTSDIIAHDAVIHVSDISRDLHNALRIMSPFGLGNRPPLFMISQITPVSIRAFGKNNEHLEIVLDSSGGTIRAIQFFTKPERYKLSIEEPVPIDLYGHIEYSVFMGKGELRMRIIDIK